MILALVLGIVLGVGLTVFTLENAGWVTVNMLIWQLSAPLAFVLVGVIAVAVFATLLGLLPTLLRTEKQVRKLQVEKKQFTDELAKYQITIPIAPPGGAARSFVITKEPEAVYAS